MQAEPQDETSVATSPETPPAIRRRRETVEVEGRRIGPYRLLHRLGQGGMGEVFLAEQEEPVRRQVALKLILSAGEASEEIVARFGLERQVLALMRHPHIAQLFDAGRTDDGAPYFVMEHVQGEPITDYCDRLRLPVGARLALFRQVCSAVQYAHQKGVIHRDLKPTNLLVTEEGGQAAVKVIDFGVAKAIAGRLAEETDHTRLDQIVGSLAFISPEQLERRPLDTRTDVHALGLLLYTLLTGVRAFSETCTSALMALILEVDPPRLPARLAALPGTELAAVAAARGTSPGGLTAAVRGDLEWIVARCLEKDPADRYASVSELAADLERHAADRPVLAAPPDLGLRLRKLVRRHRLAVTAGALVAATLVAGVVATSVALVRSRRAEARAQAEAQKATAVNDFLNQMLGSASPNEQGRDVKVADVLDRAAAQIGPSFAGQPEVAAALHGTLATTYDRLGLYDKALAQSGKAITESRKAVGEEAAETLYLQTHHALLLGGVGRNEEAVRLLAAVVARQRRIFPDDDSRLLDTEASLAWLEHKRGRHQEAAAILGPLLPRLDRALGPDAEPTISVRALQGMVFQNLGRFDEAEALYRDLLPRFERVLGASHPQTLTVGTIFGSLLNDRDRPTESEPVLRRVLAGQEKVYGPEHPETLTTRHNLTHSLLRQKRLPEAEALCRETLATRSRLFGEDHPHTLHSKSTLGAILADQGKLAEAEAVLGDALAREEKVLGADYSLTRQTRATLEKVRRQRVLSQAAG